MTWLCRHLLEERAAKQICLQPVQANPNLDQVLHCYVFEKIDHIGDSITLSSRFFIYFCLETSEMDLSSPLNYGTPSSRIGSTPRTPGTTGTPRRARTDVISEKRLRTVNLDAVRSAHISLSAPPPPTHPFITWLYNYNFLACKTAHSPAHFPVFKYTQFVTQTARSSSSQLFIVFVLSDIRSYSNISHFGK